MKHGQPASSPAPTPVKPIYDWQRFWIARTGTLDLSDAGFLADLYARWASNPSAVDPSFADLFGAMNDEAAQIFESSYAAGARVQAWDPGLVIDEAR